MKTMRCLTYTFGDCEKTLTRQDRKNIGLMVPLGAFVDILLKILSRFISISSDMLVALYVRKKLAHDSTRECWDKIKHTTFQKMVYSEF